jgi:hypothetical protein
MQRQTETCGQKLLLIQPVNLVEQNVNAGHSDIRSFQCDIGLGSQRVAADISKSFLKDAKYRSRSVTIQWDILLHRFQLALDPSASFEIMRPPFDRCYKTERVKHGRS